MMRRVTLAIVLALVSGSCIRRVEIEIINSTDSPVNINVADQPVCAAASEASCTLWYDRYLYVRHGDELLRYDLQGQHPGATAEFVEATGFMRRTFRLTLGSDRRIYARPRAQGPLRQPAGYPVSPTSSNTSR